MYENKNKLQQISCYIVIRATRTKGFGSVNLGIAIDGVHDRIPLGIYWPVENYDKSIGRLIPRYEGDTECFQHNLIIEKNLGVANQLRLQIYAYPQKINTKEFKNRFRNFDSRESFLQYMDAKIEDQFKENLIKPKTYSNSRAVLAKLKEYGKSKNWIFADVKASDIQLYFNWLMAFGKTTFNDRGVKVRIPLAYNTTIGHLKVISKYFSHAVLDKIPFENPFDTYSIGNYEAGTRQVIDATELKVLYNFRTDPRITPDQKRSLDKFLIGCFTGLRKSDIEKLKPKKHIQNGILNLNPQKTTNYGTSVEFKVPHHALTILKDYEKFGFEFDESAALNKSIKIIASKAGIDKHLKFHSSRDCFAVLYLKFGGNIADLKDILGHKRISTTEIYLKMGSDAKNDTMSKFEII